MKQVPVTEKFSELPSVQLVDVSLWLCKLVILGIRSVTLCAYLWILLLVSIGKETICPDGGILFYGFTLWMLVECCFYPYYALKSRKLQPWRGPNHSCETQEERKQLLVDSLDCIRLGRSDPDVTIFLDILSRWFHNAPPQSLYRGNLEEWMAWAFFDGDILSLPEQERAEVSELVDLMENTMKYKFPKGYSNIRSMRLTLDPLQSSQRPFIYYAAVYGVHIIAAIVIRLLGFEKQNVQGQVFHYRPSTKTNDATFLNPKSVKPIVFIHGLGVGLFQYCRLIFGFPTHADVYLLEWPHIQMKLGAEHAPSPSDTISSLKIILERDGHFDACFVAHSFGTIVPSWFLKSKDEGVSNLVSSVVLIDPIVFLLADPTVAYNFIYRTPASPIELGINYFVATELFTANTLARQFSWSHAALFGENLPSGKNSVFLSGADAIVPASKVYFYLDSWNQNNQKDNLNIFWFDSHHHGDLIVSGRDVELICAKIQEAVHH